MKISLKAQATIEYAVIAMLVIAGILVMGPYVVRSINAYFKSIDDGIEDSFDENLEQAAPIDLPDCECSNLYDSGFCGNGVNCSKNARVWIRDCFPVGCGIKFGFGVDPYECRDDENCCDLFPTNVCGVNAKNAPYLILPDGCPDDHMLMELLCGPARLPSNPRRFECSEDIDPLCVYECAAKDGKADWCPDYDLRLRQNRTPVTHIAFNAACPAAPCYAKCRDPYIPLINGAGCKCPGPSREANNPPRCIPYLIPGVNTRDSFISPPCPANIVFEGDAGMGDIDVAGAISRRSNPGCGGRMDDNMCRRCDADARARLGYGTYIYFYKPRAQGFDTLTWDYVGDVYAENDAGSGSFNDRIRFTYNFVTNDLSYSYGPVAKKYFYLATNPNRHCLYYSCGFRPCNDAPDNWEKLRFKLVCGAGWGSVELRIYVRIWEEGDYFVVETQHLYNAYGEQNDRAAVSVRKGFVFSEQAMRLMNPNLGITNPNFFNNYPP